MKKKTASIDLNRLEQEAMTAIQRIFPCEDELLDQIPLSRIIDFFAEKIVPTDDPFLIRLAGQSGSGKSSQLLPSVQWACRRQSYTLINVGSFAQFHPKYSLYQKQNPAEMREKTNGFALRALVLFYQYCIQQRVNVIMDMTLLEPEIDLYLMALAKENGYKIQMHVLCVPKKVSNQFIRLRQIKTGRLVRQTSSRYFFDALPISLKSLATSNIFQKTDKLLLWSHQKSNPIYQTHMNNRHATCVLERYRSHKYLRIKDPKKLLTAKKKWFTQLLGDI